jgi:hypothetical protein
VRRRRRKPPKAHRRSSRPTRRYGRGLSLRDKLVLAAGWLLLQVLFFFALPEWGQRVGAALLTLLALPVAVTLWMSPRSSR